MTAPDTQAVLFTCTQNAVRSVIAEALLARHMPAHIDKVASCGVIEGVPDGFAIAVMSEQGIDISAHEPSDFDSCNPEEFQIIISFSADAHHHARSWASEGCSLHFWDVRPPQHIEASREETLNSYRELREDIAHRLSEMFGINPD